MRDKNLKTYEKKRNFSKSKEPEGKKKNSKGAPIFVIQKHAASNLHYDFRLEVDGVLKSWAIPKGPSTDPSEKRLAQPTEDHPLDYADFEGKIPEEEYGGGIVMVWDKGEYENMMKEKDEPVNMKESIEKGHVEVRLKGEKIKGGYALIKTGKEKNSRWLLIKMKDDYADARRNPTSTENKSVITNRTMKRIEKEED